MNSSNLKLVILQEDKNCSGCIEKELKTNETCYESGCKHVYCRQCAIIKNSGWIQYKVLTKCSKCNFEFSTLTPRKVFKPKYPKKKYLMINSPFKSGNTRIYMKTNCRYHKKCTQTNLQRRESIIHSIPHTYSTTSCRGNPMTAYGTKKIIEFIHPLKTCKEGTCQDWNCVHKLCQPCNNEKKEEENKKSKH